MSNKKKFYLIVLTISVSLWTGLSGCGGKSTSTMLPAEATLISAPVRSEGKVVAEARVVPRESAQLSFSTSGTIEEVLVGEGEEVNAGQVITRLEGREQLEAAIKAAELELLSASQALKNLQDNAGLTRSAAQLALAEAQTAYDRAKDRSESKDFQKGDPEQIDAAYADYILALEAVEDAQEDYDKVANRLENDYERATAFSRLAAAKERRDDAWRKYDDLRSKPDEIDAAVADAALAVARAAMDKAQKDWEEVEETGIYPDDLDLVNRRITNALAQLGAAEKALDDLSLTAPFGGVIIRSDLKAGETATPGVSGVTLADTSGWKIETTDLTELDVVDVYVGQEVSVTFDALTDIELSGKVSRINGQGVNQQGDITYKVTVDLQESDDRLRWNMTSYVAFNK